MNDIPTNGTGAIGDTRTQAQKDTAFDHREIAMASPVQWTEKGGILPWKSFPVKRQYYTLECAAQSMSKHLGINNFRETGIYIDLSAEFIYWYRVNKPTGGMIWLDDLNIATTKGSCQNIRIVQRLRESDPEVEPSIDAVNEALGLRGQAFVEDKVRSIDTIAQIIENQGSCLVWFWFDVNGQEWWKTHPTIMFPNLGTYDVGATRHALCATDYGLLNGKKVIKIEDSAGNSTADNNQDRYIDEAFLTRCFVAGYVIDLPNNPKPHWTGIRSLSVGSSGDDVSQLQTILKYENLFSLKPTGYFGGITRQAVIQLQEKYASEILTPLGLTHGTGIVGNSTLKWLNNHYK